MSNLKFTAKFRLQLSEKLMDLGNITIAGLVLGQFFAKNFSPSQFIFGVIMAIVCYMVAYLVVI
jgi:hypothetical protein